MKKTVIWLCILFICLGALPICAETPDDFPINNPPPRVILAAVDNGMDLLFAEEKDKQSLFFPYDASLFASLEQFREYQREQVLPLLSAVFNCNMAGRDYVTVRAGFGTLSGEGKTKKYYLVVTLERHTDPAMRQEMQRILGLMQGESQEEKVLWLQNYLHVTIRYDEGTADCSGSVLALLDGRGVCMGYSRAFSELCRMAGIPCISVINDTHMWNSVYIDGKWWMLDVTQDIHMCEKIEGAGHEYYQNVYSLAVSYMKNRTAYKGKAKAVYMTDLTADWYRKAVEYTLGSGVFKGTSETTFSPDSQVTRAMFVTLLGRLCGASEQPHTFTDVKKGSYYAGYVGWAQREGIVQGIGNDRFAPEEHITREQMCRMMAAFADYMGAELASRETEKFQDDGEISRWAKSAVYKMKGADIIRGKGKNVFDPKGSTTRAETAVVLYQFTNYL